MFRIYPYHISHAEGDKNTYVFPYSDVQSEKIWDVSYVNSIKPKDFSIEKQTIEEEFELFHAFSNQGIRHIEGISISLILEEVAQIYTKLGYFCEEKNRFEVDFQNAPITLGCYFDSLFSLRNPISPKRHTLHQKALRKALNSGVISTLSLRKGDAKTKEEYIQLLMEAEEFSPFRLGRILGYNKKERWIALSEEEIYFVWSMQ